MTRDGTVSWRPSWTPDGRSIYYVSNAGNVASGNSMDELDVYRMPVDGSAPPERFLHHSFGLWEAEVARDGQWLLFRADEIGGVGHIYGRRLTGDTALVPLIVKETGSNQAALSPDGRWLAYTSITAGGREVYVTPFPEYDDEPADFARRWLRATLGPQWQGTLLQERRPADGGAGPAGRDAHPRCPSRPLLDHRLRVRPQPAAVRCGAGRPEVHHDQGAGEYRR